MAVNSLPTKTSQQKKSSFSFKKMFLDQKVGKALSCPNKALIVEFIKWSCEAKEASEDFQSQFYHDKKFWMFDTLEAWQERLPWASIRTIRRCLSDLKKQGWIYAEYLAENKNNRTLFYSWNKEKYAQAYEDEKPEDEKPEVSHDDSEETPCVQNGQMNDDTENPCVQNGQITSVQNGQMYMCPNWTDLHSNKSSKSPTKNTPPLSIIHNDLYQDDLAIAQAWLKHAHFEVPDTQRPKRWTEAHFHKQVAQVREATEISTEGLWKVLEFVKSNDFWCKHVWEPKMLLKKKDGVYRLTKIISQMRTTADRHTAKYVEERAVSKNIDYGNMTEDELFDDLYGEVK